MTTTETASHALNGAQSAAPLPMIYAAMSAVMGDVGAVGKTGVNKEQHYNFRSIEDVMNAARVALVKHGVFYLPTVLTRLPEQRQTRGGLPMNVIHLEIRYDFYAADGSSVAAIVWGEGADMADKATNKAMSAALKYNLVQALSIAADGVQDSDRETVEAGPAYQSAGAAFDNATPRGPRPERQAVPPLPVQVPPLADDDPWKGAIDDIADDDGAKRLWGEIAQLLADEVIDKPRADRLAAVIKAHVVNLKLAAKNGAGARQPPVSRPPIRAEDQGARPAAAPARPADGAREAAEAAWAQEFMARLADVSDLEGILPMQREIGKAVAARTIAPETGNEMAAACRTRANDLEHGRAA